MIDNDCISRESVLDALHLEGRPTKRFDYFIAVKNDIIALPTVTPKEKTAAWVPTDEEPHEIYECNACGWLFYNIDRSDFKYCPNCGASMIEVEKKVKDERI